MKARESDVSHTTTLRKHACCPALVPAVVEATVDQCAKILSGHQVTNQPCECGTSVVSL